MTIGKTYKIDFISDNEHEISYSGRGVFTGNMEDEAEGEDALYEFSLTDGTTGLFALRDISEVE